jgi:hypothetical protein
MSNRTLVSIVTATILVFVLVSIYVITPLGALGRQEAAILSPVAVIGTAAYLVTEIRNTRAWASLGHDLRP